MRLRTNRPLRASFGSFREVRPVSARSGQMPPSAPTLATAMWSGGPPCPLWSLATLADLANRPEPGRDYPRRYAPDPVGDQSEFINSKRWRPRQDWNPGPMQSHPAPYFPFLALCGGGSVV